MTKAERHTAIRDRALKALNNLYHNAPAIPYCGIKQHGFSDDEVSRWFDDAASNEIRHINDGGAYGKDYRATLKWNAERKYKSAAAINYYIAKGQREQGLELARYPADRISEYGKLYTWGRGGRTVAPDELIKGLGGSSFTMNKAAATECSLAEAVELIRIVEAFNALVEDWNKLENLQAMFDEANLADTEEAAELSET